MVVGAAQWFLQRLVTFVRPERPRPNLGAFALPPEILLMIATCLTKSSVISLALTCRTLHKLCFPQQTRLNTAEREELLLLLEMDTATLDFCHYCAKLHRWHTQWGNRMSPFVEEHLPCQQQLRRSIVLLPMTCYIPYHHARLVMNQHLYGPTHGLPLHKFERRLEYQSPVSKVRESESLHARIVEDKLLVVSIKIMSHPRGDSKTLRHYVDSLGHPACSHLTLGEGNLDHIPIQLPELMKDKTTPSHFALCDQSFRSCTRCLTDYCIDITRRGTKKGHIIKVAAYRQLGDCRSPFDWSWHTMATRHATEPPRTAHPLEYRPGIIRDRWNKADGINNRTHGEWVEIPELRSLRWPYS